MTQQASNGSDARRHVKTIVNVDDVLDVLDPIFGIVSEFVSKLASGLVSGLMYATESPGRALFSVAFRCSISDPKSMCFTTHLKCRKN